MVSVTHNFAYRMLTHDGETLSKPALVSAETTPLSYQIFYQKVAQVQAYLELLGLKPGHRVVIMFPPCEGLYILLTALMALNITAVFIDPGFPLKAIAHCIQSSQAQAVIGLKKVGVLKLWVGNCGHIPFYGVDGGLWPFVKSWKIPNSPTALPKVIPCLKEDHCLITFSSGTTGNHKASDRTHDLLIRQTAAIDSVIPADLFSSGMSTFPISAFLAFIRGNTYVIPDVELRKQGEADPKRIAAQIEANNIQGIAGSPAFYSAICSNDELISVSKSIRYVMVGGATVSQKLSKRLCVVFKHAEIVAIYGSTEVEPVCLKQITQDTLSKQEAGIHVGKPVASILLKIVDSEFAEVQPGDVGEIIVSGTHVMDRYLDPQSDSSNKFLDDQGQRWHRMGDAGFLNPEGELVLVGRMQDKMQISGRLYYPFPIEELLNNHSHPIVT